MRQEPRKVVKQIYRCADGTEERVLINGALQRYSQSALVSKNCIRNRPQSMQPVIHLNQDGERQLVHLLLILPANQMRHAREART
jgi:hypothetical protein